MCHSRPPASLTEQKWDVEMKAVAVGPTTLGRRPPWWCALVRISAPVIDSMSLFIHVFVQLCFLFFLLSFKLQTPAMERCQIRALKLVRDGPNHPIPPMDKVCQCVSPRVCGVFVPALFAHSPNKASVMILIEGSFQKHQVGSHIGVLGKMSDAS